MIIYLVPNCVKGLNIMKRDSLNVETLIVTVTLLLINFQLGCYDIFSTVVFQTDTVVCGSF